MPVVWFFATEQQEIYLGKSVHKGHNVFNKSEGEVLIISSCSERQLKWPKPEI